MPTYLDLQEEIQRLRDEQQRLRDEQEKLRNEDNASKGQHDEEGKSEEQEKVKKKPNDHENDDGQQSSEQTADNQKPPLRVRAANYARTHPGTVLIGAVVLVLTAIATLFLLNYLNSYESTDDAEVDGHLNAISTRIVGAVTGVYVENNQFVQAGQVLVDLDPRDYQTSLQQARAQVAQSQAQVAAENPNVPITVTTNQTAISSADADVRAAQASVASAQQDYDARLAAVRQAEVNHTKAALDRARFQILVDKDEISKQQFDGIAAAERNTADAIDAARASAESAKKIIDARKAQLAEARSRIQEADQNAPRQVEIRKAGIQARRAAFLAARTGGSGPTERFLYASGRARQRNHRREIGRGGNAGPARATAHVHQSDKRHLDYCEFQGDAIEANEAGPIGGYRCGCFRYKVSRLRRKFTGGDWGGHKSIAA